MKKKVQHELDGTKPLAPTKLDVDPREVESRLSSERLTFSAAARLLGVNISTIWRWSLKGVRGVKLESFCIGGKRYVLLVSLETFIAATTSAANGGTTVISTATTRQRETSISQAERELDRAGI